MSTLFGSLASKKKGVGEGWSLDTWKRDQGLLMLDKSFKASGNSSVLCKEERKAEAAQEEACQELKVIDYTWQATFVRTVKQTRNYQLLFQLEKKSRWSQCIFSGGSTGTRPSQGEHRAQKATSDVGWQVSPLSVGRATWLVSPLSLSKSDDHSLAIWNFPIRKRSDVTRDGGFMGYFGRTVWSLLLSIFFHLIRACFLSL